MQRDSATSGFGIGPDYYLKIRLRNRRYSSVAVSKANLYDLKRKDRAFISGRFQNESGRSGFVIGSGLTISIGEFHKAIDAKKLLKFKFKGKTHYSYIGFGKDALVLEVNVDTGDFNLYLPNISLDDGEEQITSVLTFKVDELIGKSLIQFKNIKKRK